MRRLLLLTFILMLSTMTLSAQRLLYNSRAPQLEVSEYVRTVPKVDTKATYVEFVVLSSPQLEQQLALLEGFASRYKDMINFVVVSRDDVSDLESYFSGKDVSYSVAVDDDGKTFKVYDIRYVPTGVVIDKKGNFMWIGKISNLTDAILLQ